MTMTALVILTNPSPLVPPCGGGKADVQPCSPVVNEDVSAGKADILDCDDKFLFDGQNCTFPGPLMSNKMHKEDLIRFIQRKSQECLLHVDEPEQRESYFFWVIMELFCKQNGKARMSEVTTVLFRGYRRLRKKASKLRGVQKQEDWCLPLAALLCTAVPEDEHIKAVIDMGGNFATKRLTFAAHLCYVLAYKESGFDLIGYESLPVGISAMKEAIERTEVYEYVLSLTSGFGQPNFQEFKFLYACKLFESGLSVQALDYCETIATAVATFPDRITNTFLDQLIRLSEKLHEGKGKEPEWLLNLRLLHKEEAALTNASMDQEQHIQMPPPLEVPSTPEETRVLPVEVGLMQMVSKPFCSPHVLELLEWFEIPHYVILILERPSPCMNLQEFCKLHDVKLPEPLAQDIMLQMVQAARHCCDRGVFHRDIKAKNVLINTETQQVKLIDFGCGALLEDTLYRKYSGTPDYYPPEWILKGEYLGHPATIWTLGILLFDLVYGDLPFHTQDEIAEGFLYFPPGPSEDCCDLISWCLERDPKSRPTFEEILRHKWFSNLKDKGMPGLQVAPQEQPSTSEGYCSRAREQRAFLFLTEEFTSQYTIGDLLGYGGAGAVYAGVRKADATEVAVKFVVKDSFKGVITIPGETRVLPVEVGLMQMVSKPFCSPHVLELLEWFEIPHYVILILERPSPCMNLQEFCKLHDVKLPEPLARDIMLQMVQAACHCCDRGVFHNDIKPGNVLINTETLQVKLIDFSCSDFLKDTPYKYCPSTSEYFPPEWYRHRQYLGCPATVWTLGIVLYQLLCGDVPFQTQDEITEGRLYFPSGLSKDCCKLISWCLEQDPKSRPTFRQILGHSWFSAGQNFIQHIPGIGGLVTTLLQFYDSFTKE